MHMHELDQIWPQMLDSATQKAIAAGRHDLADYLRLKATNDAIRSTAVNWLMDTFVEIVSEAMRSRSNLVVAREHPYTFKRGSSTLVGTLLEVQQGVRKLELAAGWTRAPSHGIMRNGALAYARFVHFGMPKAGAELTLTRGDDLPHWLNESGSAVRVDDLRRHLDILLT